MKSYSLWVWLSTNYAVNIRVKLMHVGVVDSGKFLQNWTFLYLLWLENLLFCQAFWCTKRTESLSPVRKLLSCGFIAKRTSKASLKLLRIMRLRLTLAFARWKEWWGIFLSGNFICGQGKALLHFSGELNFLKMKILQ